MKLYTTFIKMRKLLCEVMVAIVLLLCAFVVWTIALKPQAYAIMQLDEETLDFYAQNNIFYYDPTCIVSGNSTLCGDTAVEKYWSAISKYIDDPIKIAGIAILSAP